LSREALRRRGRILLSNDDGIEAEGLQVLAAALEDLAELWIIAPEQERSGHSHAISLHRPMKAMQRSPRCFSLSGTPVDCVFMAFHNFMKDAPPTLVVSGINHGANLASDVFYSGTVAVAREAALRGVPGIAVSLASKTSRRFEYAVPCMRRLCAWALENAPPGLLLNVNVPDNGKPPGGEALTRLGRHHYRFEMLEKENSEYYWLIGDVHYRHESIPGTDCVAVYEDNHISISPLSLDANVPVDTTPSQAMAAWQMQLETLLETPLETQPKT